MTVKLKKRTGKKTNTSRKVEIKTMAEGKEKSSEMGRRQFLRSFFGLGSIVESEVEPPAAESRNDSSGKFFWTSLHNGQIGCPTGHDVPIGMPGSIMKLITASALLETRAIHADEKFECRGVYKAHKQTIKCQFAHGIVDMQHALGLSCNVYFAHFASKVSKNTILEFAEKFGLNTPVADFGSGKFQAADKNAVPELLALGLTDSVRPSALQLMRVAALVATRGKVPFLHSAENPNAEAKPFEILMDSHTWHVLEQGMQIASRQGTGKKLDPENKLKLAIKTGTTPHGSSFQSWICGYFPWDAPRYAFVLRASAGTSQDQAVPQARKFLFAVDWP